jgi:O-antigen ligase
LGICTVVALIVLIGYHKGLAGWETLFSNPSTQAARVWIVKACIEIAQDRPWFGFGPGTFSAVFPFYSASYSETLPGTWRFAHADYFQTLVEWGIIGTVIWGGIFVGGIVRAALLFRASLVFRAAPGDGRRPGRMRSDTLYDGAVFLALLGVAVHALFDFPLQIASIQLYVGVLLGFAWRGKPNVDSRTSSSPE